MSIHIDNPAFGEYQPEDLRVDDDTISHPTDGKEKWWCENPTVSQYSVNPFEEKE